jgi:signal peptide peptidase SppA
MDNIEKYWCLEEAFGFSSANLLESGALKISDIMSASPLTYTIVDGTAIIPLEGVLTKKNNCWSDATSTIEFRHALRKAAHDPQVDSVLIVVDSPGGSLSGTQSAAREIGLAKERKPVHAYVEGECCSAAYWIASQCDVVHASSTAIIGSIGVLMVVPDTSRAYEKAGIKMHVIGSTDLKGAGSDGSPVTDAMILEWKSTISALSDEFVKNIAMGRGIKIEDAQKWADARVHIASDALALGMIDTICNLDDLIGAREMIGQQKTSVNVVDYIDYQTAVNMQNKLQDEKDALTLQVNKLNDIITGLNAEVEAVRSAKVDSDFEKFSQNIPPAIQPSAKRLFQSDPKAFEEIYGLIQNNTMSVGPSVKGEDLRRKLSRDTERTGDYESEFLALVDTIVKQENVDYNKATSLAARQNPELASAYRDEANRMNA